MVPRMTSPASPALPVPRWFQPLARRGLALLRPFLPAPWLARLEHAAWFVFIGTVNTGLSYVIFVVLLNLFGCVRWQALLGAYGLGMCISFQSFSRFVFVSGEKRTWTRFILAYILLYGANKLLLDTVVYAAGLSEELAQFLLLPVVAALSYFLNKLLVFRV